ncbi:MAG: MFS transporter [Planctomycetaceae bacterium]|nr:MFS transporter [Planctomycetaceae bacterium]
MSENNSSRTIFLASFLTIFAAGVGFAVRGAILNDWADQFGFTKTELGTITGGGLVGFGLVIILSSLILDRVGYKPILMLAFALHLASAVLTLAATPVYNASGKDATFACLYWGMFLFSIGNGLCEAAVNPLVATLYPKAKTHYLNILHASWPGGLIVGGMLAYWFCGENAVITRLQWEIPMATFVVPVVLYGAMIAFKRLPESEASAAGVSVGQMVAQFASPILLLLLVIHAMVGYVELGTDSWITNIMENVVKDKAILLFVYTSALMFILRFFAGPIVEHVNPLGLLAISGVLGFIGLTMLSTAEAVGMAFVAATVYALGKTFLWPTMLGVAGERFPRGGAIVMGTMGGIGMLSAGLLGGPMIGYKQDYFASQHLKEKAPAVFERYVSETKNKQLFLPEIAGLDGAKVGVLKNDGKDLERDFKIISEAKDKPAVAAEIEKMHSWWQTAKTTAAADKPPVEEAGIFGGREALRITAYVPATMAVLYLLLVVYFRLTGGYKQVEIHHQGEGAMSEL